MKTDEMTMRQAMTLLYGDIERQGPGDDDVTKEILQELPDISKNARIADLGCGTGAGSILLAEHFQQNVLCVDTSQDFLATLDDRATKQGLERFIETLQADMGALDPAKHQFDMLWSEGAAYNLTFAVALKKWRPLLPAGGIAVVSEMSWFGSERPKSAVDFWGEAYPAMAAEPANIETAKRCGFDVLFTKRLPSSSWWRFYYDPLLSMANDLSEGAPKTLREVIEDIRLETDVFRECSDYFGYTFYSLKAV